MTIKELYDWAVENNVENLRMVKGPARLYRERFQEIYYFPNIYKNDDKMKSYTEYTKIKDNETFLLMEETMG